MRTTEKYAQVKENKNNMNWQLKSTSVSFGNFFLNNDIHHQWITIKIQK